MLVNRDANEHRVRQEVENLMLCDEVLTRLNTSWVQIESEIEKWLSSFSSHPKFEIMTDFKKAAYNRKDFDLKEVRNILIGLTETAKPWEVAVGQVIGQFVNGQTPIDYNNDKLCNYLGKKIANQLRTV